MKDSLSGYFHHTAGKSHSGQNSPVGRSPAGERRTGGVAGPQRGQGLSRRSRPSTPPPFRPAAVRSGFLRYPSMRREPGHLARPTPERLIAGRAGMSFTQEAVTQQMLLRSAIILSGLRWSAVSFRCIEPNGSVLCRVSVWQITHLTKRRRQASRDPYLNGKIVVSAASLELLCSRASAWPSRRCARGWRRWPRRSLTATGL